MSNVIAGLDLGSELIRVAVGQVQPDNQIHIIGAAEGPSEGISKGVITSIEDTVSSISGAMERAERMVGLPLDSAFVGISGTHIISQDSHGVIAVARADGEIREDDVERALEAAQTVATPPNYEILHVVPRSFIVDNQRGIKDPIGMTGIRLEVDAQIIEGLSSQIKNLTKCLARAGVTIDDLVFTVLATSEAVLVRRQKELGVGVINLGDTTVGMTVFEEGDILTAKVLPIGSRHITSDIAIGLRISLDLAETIKLNYGSTLPGEISKSEEINLKELSETEEAVVSKKHVAEIIYARVEEIFKMVDAELKAIGRSGKLPAGIILTGAGAKLPGLAEVAKKTFKLPASIGYPQSIVCTIDKVNDPAFTTAVGLVLWGRHFYKKGGLARLPGVGGMGKRVRKWFKSLLP